MSKAYPGGSSTGEPGWATARREKLLAGLDLSRTRGIEIGPLAWPLARKSEADVRYVDWADQATLKTKYAADPNVNVADIVDVDMLWGERTLSECFPDDPGFDYVIASHVIEHVPDMIGWLKEVAEVLRPGGRLYLTVPDKRYTFDHFRRTSGLAEFIGAYLVRSRRPSPAQVFDQGAYHSKIEAHEAWKVPPNPTAHMNMANLRQALEVATIIATQPQYLDVHCWVFTPRSLLETLVALLDLDLLGFRCLEFRDTLPSENEMSLVLEKIDTSDPTVGAAARLSFVAHLACLPLVEPNGSAATDEPSLAMAIASPGKPAARHAVATAQSAWRPAAQRLAWALRRLLPERLRAPRPTMLATRQTIPAREALGREIPPYRRTFDFPGDFIDKDHRAIQALPTEGGLIRTRIPGFLRPADALALYELAYFSTGDVLEIGSAWGLSTTFLCRSVINAGRGTRVVSFEMKPEFHATTARNVHDQGLWRCFHGVLGNADVIDSLGTKRGAFGFIFIDFDNTHGAVRRICKHLPELLRPDGIVLFHDFNDVRNISEPQGCDAYSAVVELLRERMVFMGIIGCCALIHRPTA